MLKTQHMGPLPAGFGFLREMEPEEEEQQQQQEQRTARTGKRSARLGHRETEGDIDTNTATRRQVTILSERSSTELADQESGAMKPARKRHLASLAGQVSPDWHDRGQQVEEEDDDEQVEPPEATGDADKEVNEGDEKGKKEFKPELVWFNIFLFVILHSSLPASIYLLYTQRPWKTMAFSVLCMYLSALGVTGGTHRLWSHRSFRAKWPVEALLVVLQTMAGQNSAYTWSRDHRVHHKYSETDADPHNIKRGFFFAHMGWLCCRKHPDVKLKGRAIDLSDLESNSIVMFQHRHFWWMAILFTVLVPTMVPVLCWGERFWTSFALCFMFRYLVTLHGTWLVNSAAHYYGQRPYDGQIEARESAAVIMTGLGEGFHNYHHTFPYDYATSEWGQYFNITTVFIDLCALLGLVDGRRKVDRETILRRRKRTGDLSLAAQQKADKRKGAGGAGKRVSFLRSKSANCISDHIDGAAAAAKPLNSIIHELPYISGLTSMKYTM